MEDIAFVKKDSTIRELVSEARKGKKHFIVLDEKGEYYGIIPEHLLVRISLNLDSKIEQFAIRVSPLLEDFDPREAIELFISSGSRVLPIKNNKGVIVGFYTINEALKYILENYPDFVRKEVEEAMSSDVITIHERDSIAKALSLMRRYGISRLIVVDDSNKAVGIVTIGDIVRKIIFELEDAHTESIKYGTYPDDNYEVEVRSIMSTELLSVDPKDPIKTAINIMVERDIYGLPVLRNRKPFGIITGKDILAHFIANVKKEEYSLIVHGIKLDEYDIAWMKKRFEMKILRKYKEILGDKPSLIIHVKKVREVVEQDNTMRFFTVKARLIGSGVKLYASEDTIDLYSAFSKILEIFDEELSKIKHKRERDWFLERILKEGAVF